MLRVGVTLCALVAASAVGRADPVVLRLANVAPDGTVWAHAFKAAAREVSETTSGRVQMKWYLGGIAGDEPEVVERIKRGQLDGAAFTLLCAKLAPSLKVMFPFDDRAEHDWVMNRLRPRVDEELSRIGLVGMGVATLGTTILFTRQRVGSLDDLKKLHLWVFDSDDVLQAITKRMGLHIVTTSLDAARAAADAGKIDGFLSVPAAVFAYQWSTRLRYFVRELHVGIPSGCVVLSRKTYERLAPADRETVRQRLERLTTEVGSLMREQDEKLLGGLFEKHGLAPLTLGDAPLKAALAALGSAAHDAIADLVSPEVIAEVRALTEQYRKR